MSKTLKLEIDMSIYSSLDALKHTDVVDETSRKVNDVLREKDKQASASSIMKASKNALSLLLHRKKQTIPPVLPIYLPMNLVQCVSDTVVPTVSSDEDMPQPSEEEHDNSSDSNSEKNTLSPISHSPLISFSVCNGLVKIDVTFEYLQDYLKHSLSVNNKPMNLDKMVTDICTYVFLDLRYSVHVRSLKNEICRQISYIVQSARVRASGRSAIGILRTTKSFSLTSKSIICLNYKQLDIEFSEYRNSDDLSPILLIRKNDEETDIFQFYPLSNTVEITVNDTLVKKCLSSFDLTRTIDVYELSCLVTKCALVHNIQVDVLLFEEEIKTKILFDYMSYKSNPCFLTVVLKFGRINETMQDSDQTLANNNTSYSVEEIDAIIGRTYDTRGIKRTYEEDPISIEPSPNMYTLNKISKDKRDLLHLKDSYHLTDSAFNAIFQYIQGKRKVYSLKEIERVKKKTNTKFPILFTASSANVKFEYAVRTAVFVARKYRPKLDQFDTLNIRFNMDGTLIGNKHVVAISINCIEGGHQCQMAKSLVPLGLFEVQKENTEILRKSLPVEFIRDIKSIKKISIGNRNVDIRVRLGGDLMNAVYVFGLAGFSSNYPCIFCTQHKDDLHVTEDTTYDKNATEGKGKNKKAITIRVGPTSCHDISKRARTLAEQFSCLAKQPNDLGYKCEPLFGDLFDYQDYCIDTLHMKLRIFDVILKDILSSASRTGKYGSEHLTILEKKIKILNQHCEKTVGKRFFFQIDSDDKNKTITSHGKLSGHLQDLFFIDSFPYDDILQGDTAKAARSVVKKFKEILVELKHTSLKRKSIIKRLSLEFVKEFRRSGLRMTVTPYIHIIGNHLFEFDEFHDLGDYNMQGVEKHNDVLSRLYFSSTNPAKNPLLTMLQKLYRMLEMNFQNEKERNAMAKFANTGVYDFVEDLSENESNAEDNTFSSNSQENDAE